MADDNNTNVNNGIFTEEEQELMELTKKVRVDVIKNMVKNGPPEKTREIEVLVMTASSLDKQVNDNAANRLKFQDNNNKEAVLDIVAEALKAVSKSNGKIQPAITSLPQEHMVDDFAPGEAIIDAEVLEISDFIPKEEE